VKKCFLESQDPDRLIELIREIDRLLGEKESAAPAAEF
jgi:hypothetical protein